MLILAVLSPVPRSGKTTILVNLAVGLQRKQHRVLIASGQNDSVIRNWLNPMNQVEIAPGFAIEGSALGVDFFIKPDHDSYLTYPDILKDSYDYILLDAGSDQNILGSEIMGSDIIIACVEAGASNNHILELENRLRELSNGSRGIELVVPAKARMGEWERNVEHLMALTEHFGADRIADFIPFCEAIHDLPRENKAVWDLPEHYGNRKQAFDRLVDNVLKLDAIIKNL